MIDFLEERLRLGQSGRRAYAAKSEESALAIYKCCREQLDRVLGKPDIAWARGSEWPAKWGRARLDVSGVIVEMRVVMMRGPTPDRRLN